MIFYLVCFLGRFFNIACGLFWCHRTTFYNGVRTILTSSFWWWSHVHVGAMMSVQQAFLSYSTEYDAEAYFFIVNYYYFLFILFFINIFVLFY